ncbi:hypothetical protein N7452_009623 [Penicillium brevicompactum]|uniref:Uncharacterized protein n=1 Tax=Penicillium brevicompactum TaxID=5074 RepID=A0A9W9QBI9_PENBR|nr:hypothetical protein N7452_009623 [Penicillium brevicompactum]
MGHDSDSTTLGKAFFRYRGLMIRSLNDDISIQDRRSDDVVLAGILTLMLADAQQGISQHWRYHIEGVRRLIILRGGVRRLVATSPGVLPIVLSFIYIVVTADTTSPASDMLVEGLDIDELYEIVKEYGGNGYGFQMCPAPLFAELIQINHVRSQIPKLNCGNEDELRTDAYEILRRIYHFSPDAWMALNECLTDERRLVINIYQSAVASYCMSSLHILLYLPSDSLLRKNSDMERRILRELLEKALRSRPRGYIFWPLVVLGVRSVDGGPALREFVRQKMIDLSAFFGTYSPLAAKGVLERFWASGKTNWDACFDEAHMFTTVLTVNRGQLSSRPS